MLSVLAIVTPVFALIAIGYGGARSGYLSAQGQKGVAEFAFSLAIPALLFRTIAGAKATALDPLAIWLAYFGTVACIWSLAAVSTRLVLRRPATDAPAIAMASVYGNVVMLGIPLCLASLGEAAAAPMAVILAIHTPVMWFAGTAHQAIAARSRQSATAAVALRLVIDLARNPLIVAIVAGGLWRLTGLGLERTLDSILALIGQAGVPASLVALGAALSGFAIKGQSPTLTLLLVLKLAAMPAVAVLLAQLLRLPPAAVGVVVLFAAMPAGANAYLFAQKVQAATNSASGAVALGTLLSAATITAAVRLLAP